jgi:hypothetical protein
LRSASALIVSTVASGFLPASGHDGGSSDLRLDVGEREGPICLFLAFNEVFYAFARDSYVISYLMGSFVVMYFFFGKTRQKTCHFH